MNFALNLAAAVAVLAAPVAAANAPTPAQRPAAYTAMEGNWTVDLRLSLDDAVYTQPMILKIAADRAVTGSLSRLAF